MSQAPMFFFVANLYYFCDNMLLHIIMRHTSFLYARTYNMLVNTNNNAIYCIICW